MCQICEIYLLITNVIITSYFRHEYVVTIPIDEQWTWIMLRHLLMSILGSMNEQCHDQSISLKRLGL